jgi:cobalamin biosynthesis protein CbiG
VLQAQGQPIDRIVGLASLDTKGELLEPICNQYGWQLRLYGAAALAGVAVSSPSLVVNDRVGTPSVAEAALLLAGAQLLLPKMIYSGATGAITLAVGTRSAD